MSDPSIVKVCAWCPDSEVVSASFEKAGVVVSHGLCRSHYDELVKELDRHDKLREKLKLEVKR